MHSVIFFLAHSGVTQPSVWETWLKECNSYPGKRVDFRIFSDVDEPFITPERKLHFKMKTEWASPSLVAALQTGYSLILNDFPHVDMIFLVSGFDIPIMSPHNFWQLPRASYVPISEYLDQLEKEEFNELSIHKICKYRNSPKIFSVQWIHILSADAKIISDAPLEPYVEWMKVLNETFEQTYVYDEVLPCAMLSAKGRLDSLKDEPLTDFERKHEGDPSPIVWNSLKGKVSVARPLDDGEIAELYSLENVLKESVNDKFLFFRKISRIVEFEKMPWLY
jgi:hypothetical protein